MAWRGGCVACSASSSTLSGRTTLLDFFSTTSGAAVAVSSIKQVYLVVRVLHRLSTPPGRAFLVFGALATELCPAFGRSTPGHEETTKPTAAAVAYSFFPWSPAAAPGRPPGLGVCAATGCARRCISAAASASTAMTCALRFLASSQCYVEFPTREPAIPSVCFAESGRSTYLCQTHITTHP